MEDGASFFLQPLWILSSSFKNKKKTKKALGFFFYKFFFVVFFYDFSFFLLEELKYPWLSPVCQICNGLNSSISCQIVLRAPQSLELLAERFPWNCQEEKTKQNKKTIQKRQNSKILSAPLLFIHGLLRPTGEGNCMAGKIKACAQRGQGYF